MSTLEVEVLEKVERHSVRYKLLDCPAYETFVVGLANRDAAEQIAVNLSLRPNVQYVSIASCTEEVCIGTREETYADSEEPTMCRNDEQTRRSLVPILLDEH